MHPTPPTYGYRVPLILLSWRPHCWQQGARPEESPGNTAKRAVTQHATVNCILSKRSMVFYGILPHSYVTAVCTDQQQNWHQLHHALLWGQQQHPASLYQRSRHVRGHCSYCDVKSDVKWMWMVCMAVWWVCDEALETKQRKKEIRGAREWKKWYICISKSSYKTTQLFICIINIWFIDDLKLEYLHLDGQYLPATAASHTQSHEYYIFPTVFFITTWILSSYKTQLMMLKCWKQLQHLQQLMPMRASSSSGEWDSEAHVVTMHLQQITTRCYLPLISCEFSLCVTC